MSQPAPSDPGFAKKKNLKEKTHPEFLSSYLPLEQVERGWLWCRQRHLGWETLHVGDPQGGTNPKLLNGNLQKSPSRAIKSPLFCGLICYWFRTLFHIDAGKHFIFSVGSGRESIGGEGGKRLLCTVTPSLKGVLRQRSLHCIPKCLHAEFLNNSRSLYVQSF